MLRGNRSGSSMSPTGGTPGRGSLSPTTPMGGFGSAARERVKVHVRLRPANHNDARRGDSATGEGINVGQDGEVSVTRGIGDIKKFKFDTILGPESHQADVFAAAGHSIIEDVTNGYNGCIMCYGQTGTGKTYTLGNDSTEGMAMSENTMGITGRALRMIFEAVRNDSSSDFQVSISYVQIYMEMIQDLLEVKNDQVQVREDPEKGVFLQGASVYRADSEAQCQEIIQHGNSNRCSAFTEMNAHSSRSHAVLCVMVQKRTVAKIKVTDLGNGVTKDEQENLSTKSTAGKLYCVDLAGSERAKKSGAKGTRMEELKSINMSLSALGNCISALADASAGKNSHIPFRDSRLTRLLQDSLGGNAKTSLVVTIGPSIEHVAETINSLQFGQRAMRVVMHAKVNQELDYKSLCIQLQAELDCKDDIIHHLENRLKLAEERLKDRPVGGGFAEPSPARAGGAAGARSYGASPAGTANMQAADDRAEAEGDKVITLWKGKMHNLTVQCDQRYSQMEGMLTKEVEQLREELAKAASRVASSKTVMDRQRKEMEQAQEELNKLETEHFQRLRDLLEKQEDLKGQLKEKTVKVNSMQSADASAQAATSQADQRRLAEASDTVARLTSQVKSSQEATMLLQRKVSDHESKARQDNLDGQALRQEVAQLKHQISRESSEKATLGSKADQLAADKVKAKDLAQTQIRDVQTQAMAAERMVADLKLQMKHKEAETARAEKARDKELEKAKDLQNQLNAATTVSSEAQQAARSKGAEASKADSAIKELNRKVDAQQLELNATKDKLQKETSKCADLIRTKSSALDANSQEIDKLQADFLAAHTKADELAASLKATTADKEALQAKGIERDNLGKQKAQEVMRLQQELKTASSSLETKTKDLAELQQRSAQGDIHNETTIRELQEAVQTQTTQLNKKTHECIEVNEELMLVKSSTEAELEQVHEESAVKAVEVLSLQQKSSSLEASVSAKNSDIEKLEEKVRQLHDERAADKEVLESFEVSTSDAAKAAQESQSIIVGHVMELGALESRIVDLEDELAGRDAAITSHENGAVEAAQEQFQAQETISDRERQIADLESTVIELQAAAQAQEFSLTAQQQDSADAAHEAQTTIVGQVTEIRNLEEKIQEREAELRTKQLEADDKIGDQMSQLGDMRQQVADLQDAESRLKSGLDNSEETLRAARQEAEGVQNQMTSQMDATRRELEDSQNTSDALSANKHQLEADLENARGEIDLLHNTHKTALQQKEQELAKHMQEFDHEVARMKDQLGEMTACHSDASAHLETQQHMYAEAQADLTHLNDKYKRAKHLLSQRHWRGAGNAVFAFFRNHSGASKLKMFQSWKALLLHKVIGDLKKDNRDHLSTIMDEAAKRAKLKKQALNVQKQNQTIRSAAAEMEEQDVRHQVATGKALLQTSRREIESFFTKVETFFLEENAKSYKQYKDSYPSNR